VTGASRGISSVRQVIDNAVAVPPVLQPFAAAVPAPTRERAFRPLPIELLGITEATAGESVDQYGIGESLFVYCDTRGCRRPLSPGQHDRTGVASLFLLEEGRLPTRWPSPKGRTGWDPHQAAAELICRQGLVGVLKAKRGELLVAEPEGAWPGHRSP
jgi:hypothetical protein